MMMGENKNKDPAGVPRERTGRLDLNEEEYVPEAHGETWEGETMAMTKDCVC